MNLNTEKQRIIAEQGNILVTANPGTGKTLLLAGKYLELLKKGITPEKILCLTFTEKAKSEMGDRIIKAIKEENINFDYSKLNVFTFHSHALNNLDSKEIISSNLLRYEIYKYMTDNEILNYDDNYLVETIIPKMDTLLRYLKSFGITPEQIDLKKVKLQLKETDKNTKEELDAFAEHFINIFKHYEKAKSKKGYDYADLLIEFLKLKKHPVYDYVLIDELQDVNSMEADIALKSCKNFFAVGDKKQAIFGFQGGSILNFEKFSKCKKFILSENYRSTNEILSYAKDYFMKRSNDENSKIEVASLKNPEAKKGVEPFMYECLKENIIPTICELLKKLKDKKQAAIIARTNYQLANIAKELKARGVPFATSLSISSVESKNEIITFLRGSLSNDIADIKRAMFTPYFPIRIQKAFELASDKKLDFEKVGKECPEYAKLREKIKTTEDLNLLFEEIIIPTAISYGKEHLIAAIKMQEALIEGFLIIDDLNIDNLEVFLKSSELLSSEIEAEKQIILTTVHKAKGRQFDTVIYIPSKKNDKSNFQDEIVKAILKTQEINAEEELEEEDLRVNFVAFTRAEKELLIITDKPEEHLNNYCNISEPIKFEDSFEKEYSESKHKAYALFLNEEFDSAKKVLNNKEPWIIEYATKHFASLDHISPTSLRDNAYDYLIDRIINLQQRNKSLQTGTEAHSLAESLTLGKKIEVEKEMNCFKENILKILSAIKLKYPITVSTEEKIEIALNKILPEASEINFVGKIDAVFKNNDEYLIVDWKTDKDTKNDSKHRQQLEAYKRAYSIKNNIPLEKIKTAIAFIGLRTRINTGIIESKYDERQPAKSAFETFSKKTELLLSWKKDANKFFTDLAEKEVDDNIWRATVEEWRKEKKVTG